MNGTEQEILDQITLDAPWELIETFATMPREAPKDVIRGADAIAERLRAHGVPVTVHEPDLYLSLPISASVEAGGERYEARPPSFSVSAPDGVEAEMVYVPSDAAKGAHELAATAAGVPGTALGHVAGKIVVAEGFALPGLAAEFADAGATGIIAVNPGARIHGGTVNTVWGSPGIDERERLPGIVAAAVNNADGKKLIERAKRGERARISTRLDAGWFPSKLPVAEILGNEEPDQFLLLHGHYDSWDVGVSDNATGNACMLEIARLLWKHRGSLERSVRIAWWPGHSTGRYAGSTWFSDAFAIDLAENCVAHVNCDSPGCRWATAYDRIPMMAEIEGLVSGAVADATGASAAGGRPPQAGDYSFNNIGISGCFMGSSMIPTDVLKEKGYYLVNGSGGNIEWHTDADTLEVADKDVLLTDTKLYLLTVLRIVNADVLPLDWRRTVGEFLDTIASYQAAAGDRFDLTPAGEAAEALEGALQGFYGAIEAGAVPAARANAVIRDLARILVPVNFAQEPRFAHDPARRVPPLPTLETALRLAHLPEAMVGFARTQLTRGQNRFVAAMDQARRLVAGA